MNIVPNLHSMLISMPKIADVDYVAVFNKKEARIYDSTTTIVSATKDHILVAPCCQDTGLWKLDLDYEVLGHKYPDQFIAGVDKANAIFDLPNTRQSLLYHCEHIGDTSICSQEGISIFKFPERFLEISCRDLITFTFQQL
jgi:hypothetical protein